MEESKDSILLADNDEDDFDAQLERCDSAWDQKKKKEQEVIDKLMASLALSKISEVDSQSNMFSAVNEFDSNDPALVDFLQQNRLTELRGKSLK